jgi:serine/threonine protein kinase
MIRLGSELELAEHGYRWQRRIGSGQVGDIYLAVRDADETYVAIKIASRISKGRNEARLLAHVSAHENVASLLDQFKLPEGYALVLQYAESGNLLDFVIRNGRLGEKLTCQLWRQLVDALIHAHKCGVCHRDVKLESMWFSVRIAAILSN